MASVKIQSWKQYLKECVEKMNERARIVKLEKENRRLEKENKELKKNMRYNFQEVRHEAMREGFMAAEVWYNGNSNMKASYPP